MSGICGICQPGREIARTSLEPMLLALDPPGELGREGRGGNSAALGVARRWPFQQMAAIPGVRIVLDADLTDLHGLDSALAAKGLDAAEMSLAECIASLYLIEGIEFVNLLKGPFALALWDERVQRLLLAVDRLGIKSLYWSQADDRLLFASRAGAIRAAEDRPAEVNPAALVQYLLFSVVPAPLVIYQGMEKLRPGHWLVYENGRVGQHCYWDLEYPESKDLNVGQWAEAVREAMRAAVGHHLEGCAPDSTGAYLSGGTDSSSVVAFMNERHSPVNTFSISFEEQRYNEINFARITAGNFGTRHYERCLGPADAAAAIPKIVEYYDEPFANSSAIGGYYCALLARESGIETLFAGDGGDELFGGNERYATDKYFALYHALPAWLRRGVLEPVAGLLPLDGGLLSLPRRYIRRANIPNPRRIFSFGLFLNTPPEAVFESGFLEQVPPAKWLAIAEEHFHAARARSDLNRLMYLDLKMILADNDLRKVSGTAELAGVRVRFPLLDYRLAETSCRIPSNLKLKGFEKRYIFKRAMKGILPNRVLYKKKHGFGVPIGHWFLADPQLKSLIQDVLCDPRTRQRGYFRREFLDRLMDLHRRDHAGYYGEVIWYLVALELWHRQHLERNVGSPCAN